MANLEQYRAHIEQLIREYGRYKPSYGEVEVQMIFDRENDHYQLCNVGWEGHQRVHGCVLHLDIKNDKIWIQHDGTEDGIADELVALGIPKDKIVLAYHAPYKRKYSGFAEGS
jgi:hypothetical protein